MTESGGCVSEGITESYDRAPYIHISMRSLWFECQSECQLTWMTTAVKKDTQSGVSLSSPECDSLMCKGGDASGSNWSCVSHRPKDNRRVFLPPLVLSPFNSLQLGRWSRIDFPNSSWPEKNDRPMMLAMDSLSGSVTTHHGKLTRSLSSFGSIQP